MIDLLLLTLQVKGLIPLGPVMQKPMLNMVKNHV